MCLYWPDGQAHSFQHLDWQGVDWIHSLEPLRRRTAKAASQSAIHEEKRARQDSRTSCRAQEACGQRQRQRGAAGPLAADHESSQDSLCGTTRHASKRDLEAACIMLCVAQECQSTEAEEGVKDVGHVAWPAPVISRLQTCT